MHVRRVGEGGTSDAGRCPRAQAFSTEARGEPRRCRVRHPARDRIPSTGDHPGRPAVGEYLAAAVGAGCKLGSRPTRPSGVRDRGRGARRMGGSLVGNRNGVG